MKVSNDILGVSIILLCLSAVIGFGAYALVNAKSLEHVNTIISELMGVVLLLVGYFWGSSKGSRDKTELLNRNNSNTDAEVNK